jgi:hypothetical protein
MSVIPLPDVFITSLLDIFPQFIFFIVHKHLLLPVPEEGSEKDPPTHS